MLKKSFVAKLGFFLNVFSLDYNTKHGLITQYMGFIFAIQIIVISMMIIISTKVAITLANTPTKSQMTSSMNSSFPFDALVVTILSNNTRPFPCCTWCFTTYCFCHFHFLSVKESNKPKVNIILFFY